jgi:putative heme-binding domain-containing protein
MNARSLAVWLVTAAAAAAAPPPLVAPGEARSPQQEKAAFHLPPGFEAQLVAADPDIHKPMNLAFDARGRLWLTDTLEYPYPAQGRPGRDRVVVLDRFGPDGKAGRVTLFADGLNIPIGVLPLPDGKSAIVYTLGEVLKLTDTDGDGKADRRETLFKGFGTRDTHGMINGLTLGPDGWVYACHGFSNESAIAGRDGQELRMQSGNTFRFRPDGSHAEAYTRGQVNPFGMTTDPWGNLYTADCHSRPLTQLIRGAYYQSFGKPHDGLGFGPDMIGHDHGSTGICGPCYYAAEQFPPPYRDTLFVCNPVTSRVNHDKLEYRGTTPVAVEQPDFLTSEDLWFRPVDLKLGPDGAMYVADFYNRIIGHYEVPLDHPGRDRKSGRVWRVIYRGPDGQAAPPPPPRDLTVAPVKELVAALGDPNLTVRMLATHQLLARGEEAGDEAAFAFHESENPLQRAHAMWVLEGRRATVADAAIDDRHPLVRTHALRALAERPKLSDAERSKVRARLSDPEPRVRRAAVETLARHAGADAADLRAVLDMAKTIPLPDTHLRHTARVAARDMLRRLPAGTAPRDEADARLLAEAALGVPTAEAAHLLAALLDQHPAAVGDTSAVVRYIARHATDTAVRDGLLRRARETRFLLHRANLLRDILRGQQERGGPADAEMRRLAAEAAGNALDDPLADVRRAGVELAALLRLPSLDARLAQTAASAKAPDSLRAEALAALTSAPANVPAVARVLADGAASQAVRERAAQVLGQGDRPEARAALAAALPSAPARLALPVAGALAGTRDGAKLLLDLAAAGKAAPRLLTEPVVRLRLAAHKSPDLDRRVAELTRGLPSADQQVAELIRRRLQAFPRQKADVALGQKAFATHCAACHQVGGQGGKVGPQLDGVGVRGAERLLEDLLDPNRNVDQAFRATTLALTDGRVLTGLVLREEGAVVVLADALGKEVRVPKADIEERKVSGLSPMPADFGQKVSEADMGHLLAYLLAQRAKQ